MEQTRVVITDDVLEGLEAVRLSGKTNMLDRPRVVELACEMGYDAAALWVGENRKLYAEGIFRGFAAESLSNPNSSRYDAQHGAADRTDGKPSGLGDMDQGGDKECVDK